MGPSLADLPSSPMVCSCEGDPHCKSFGGVRCDVMGLGVFPMVDLPHVRVETFHCPVKAGGYPGASTIAAVAMRVRNDTVILRGGDVTVNGESMTKSQCAGNVVLNISM